MMQVELSGDQSKLVSALIASGRFTSAEQVIETALQSLAAEQSEYEATVADVRAGLDDERAGRVSSITTVANQLRDELGIERPS